MYPRQKTQKTIPAHIAHELVAQRDSLAAEVASLRAEVQRLSAEAEQNAATIETLNEELFLAEQALESGLGLRVRELERDLERVHRQLKDAEQAARAAERAELLDDLGGVVDAVGQALAQPGAPGPWRDGMQAIAAQLDRFLESKGTTLTGKVGERFDPAIHEAVDVVEGGEPGIVTEVFQHGLASADRVIRNARVRVSR